MRYMTALGPRANDANHFIGNSALRLLRQRTDVGGALQIDLLAIRRLLEQLD